MKLIQFITPIFGQNSEMIGQWLAPKFSIGLSFLAGGLSDAPKIFIKNATCSYFFEGVFDVVVGSEIRHYQPLFFSCCEVKNVC